MKNNQLRESKLSNAIFNYESQTDKKKLTSIYHHLMFSILENFEFIIPP